MVETHNHRRRADLLFALLILAVVGLSVRMCLLVKEERDRCLGRARRQQRTVVRIPARPGNIYAVAGKRWVALASSRQAPGCYADPNLMDDSQLMDVSIRGAEALGMDPVGLYERLMLGRRSRFRWLKRDLSESEAEAVRRMRHPALRIAHEWRRTYPNGALAATVVGFRRPDGRPGGGMELVQDAALAARDGKRVLLADAAGRGFWPLVDESRAPRDGRHVLLSLDLIIQGYLQEAVGRSVDAYSAKWGTGVVIDPRTGQVLAMCSSPTFNPNSYSTAAAAERTNRAISCPFEPGSAAKPLFAAAAVDAGVLSWDTKIFCENGSYHARGGGHISDHGKHYGWLSLTDVVVHSSNIGMAKVGEMLGNAGLHAAARRFGFGQKTGVGLPAESRGQLRPLRRWDGYSLRRVPFGQEISTTALQLVMAFGTLANGGVLLEPRIVDRITDAGGNTVWRGRRKVVRRVLRPATADQAREAMRQVVLRGTGRSSRMRSWSSFGKTGTAQIAGPGGYPDGAYVGSFIAGAPVRDTRLLCLISIYWPDRSKGYYGSKVAAPYVKEVLRKSLAYLDVPPDQGAAIALSGR